MHTAGRVAAALGTVALATLVTAAPALAEDPFAMTERVVDRTTDQVVAADLEQIDAAADDVVAQTDFDLWTVYVDSFDDVQAVDWANDTAIASGADTDVLLLAIAVDDREVALSVAEEADIRDSAVTDIEAAARAEVRRGDWTDASIAAASTIIELATGRRPRPRPPTTTPAAPAARRSGSSRVSPSSSSAVACCWHAAAARTPSRPVSRPRPDRRRRSRSGHG